MLDGKAVFASTLIRCDTSLLQDIPLQICAEGIVCYLDHEVEHAERLLKKRGIPYTIEALAQAETTITKAAGVKYASRSEILDHIERDVEPEGAKMANLKKRLDAALAELDTLKTEKQTLETSVGQMEAKMALLETSIKAVGIAVVTE
jgi:chromosome segregation ATPase